MVLMVLGFYDELERKVTPLYYVIGKSKSDCERKFSKKVLGIKGKYKSEFDNWVSQWRTKEFIEDNRFIV